MRPCDLDGRWKSWPWFLGVRRSDWDCMWCIIGPPIPKATKAPPSVMGQNVRFPLVLTLGLGIALAIPATAGTPDWSLLECKALQTRTKIGHSSCSHDRSKGHPNPWFSHEKVVIFPWTSCGFPRIWVDVRSHESRGLMINHDELGLLANHGQVIQWPIPGYCHHIIRACTGMTTSNKLHFPQQDVPLWFVCVSYVWLYTI